LLLCRAVPLCCDCSTADTSVAAITNTMSGSSFRGPLGRFSSRIAHTASLSADGTTYVCLTSR
jgi:hypothetical protein